MADKRGVPGSVVFELLEQPKNKTDYLSLSVLVVISDDIRFDDMIRYDSDDK